jgi:hypothetical protein
MNRSICLVIFGLSLGLVGCVTEKRRIVIIPGLAESGSPRANSGQPRRRIPPPNANIGKLTKLDLRTAPPGTFYSLQVAHFDDPTNEALRKKQAEAYTKELRSKGAEAYFYHGPTMSVVTVGSFKDAVMRVGSVTRRADGSRRLNVPSPATRYSPEVEKMQAKYPYHMHNGRPIYYKKGDGTYLTYPRGHARAGKRIAQSPRPVGIPGRKPPI